MTELFKEIYKLKNLCRKGWIVRDVSDPNTKRVESDAEHTFSMAVLACEIMEREHLKLDEAKVLKMILFHELGEIDVGDVTPIDHVPLEQKYCEEHKCICRLSNLSSMPEIESLWLEFEENSSPEARFVKALDKLDCILQSKIYATFFVGIKKLCPKFY